MKLAAVSRMIAIFAAILFGGSLAAAHQVLVGSFDAVGDKPLSPDTAIAVSAESFTDLNNRLQPMIETALAADGYQVDPDAELELTFDAGSTDATTAARLAEPEDSVLDHAEVEIMRGRDNRLDPLDTSYKSKELESMEGKVNFDLQNIHDVEDGQASHTLWFVLGERGEPPAWQGSLRALAQPQDPLVVLKRMVPVLAKRIGETANSQKVEIP